MCNIDWTKPIETVPCDRNPVPVPCEVRREDGQTAICKILGDWFDPTSGDNNGNDTWEFFNGDPLVRWLPKLRNVVTPGGSTIADSDGDDLA